MISVASIITSVIKPRKMNDISNDMSNDINNGMNDISSINNNISNKTKKDE